MFYNIRARIRRRWRDSRSLAAFLGPVRRYLPTARIRDAVMTRRGLKWGVPAMLLAVPYYLMVYALTEYIAQGGLPLLHLVVLLCVWNTLKMLWLGPMSLIALLRVRLRERAARRESRRTAETQDAPADERLMMAGGVS